MFECIFLVLKGLHKARIQLIIQTIVKNEDIIVAYCIFLALHTNRKMFFIFVYMCTCVAKMALFMMLKSSLFRIVFMSGISPLSEKDREREEKERIRKRERDRNTVGLTSGLLTHLTHTHTHISQQKHTCTHTHTSLHTLTSMDKPSSTPSLFQHLRYTLKVIYLLYGIIVRDRSSSNSPVRPDDSLWGPPEGSRVLHGLTLTRPHTVASQTSPSHCEQ